MGCGEKILQEIQKCGPIPFSRFMELALYCPDSGFYEAEADRIGRRGDFYTSVSTGSLFGELLAFDFSEKLFSLQSQCPALPLQLVEAGAHDGKLTRDILTWLRDRRPDQFKRISYVIIEPSAKRRVWQQHTLHEFADTVRWLDELPKPARSDSEPLINGILFSNELLDAFPVRRIGWDTQTRTWFEWGVESDGANFSWTRLNLAVADAAQLQTQVTCPPEILDVLPNGFTTEICPAAAQWWTHATVALGAGWLLTADYGLTNEELFQPHRTQGTLRSYFKHRLVPDVLSHPGEQDITAHVDFSAIRAAGETALLSTEFFGTQAAWLTRIMAETLKAGTGFGEWDAARTRQFQTLTHPEFLGRAFRVLVQRRDSKPS
jgi:SAM-dependent MidA family methyltransferase